MTNEEALDRLKVISDYEYDEDLQAIEMAIEALQERKTGKWIHLFGKCHCNNCGHVPVFDTEKDSVYYSPYCPNCGAKMEVDE